MVPGGPNLGLQEYPLSAAWFYRDHPLERKTSHNLLTSFSRLACQAAGTRKAAIVLIDVAPGLGAINRAAFLACDAVVVALSSAPISFWNLPALGVSLRQWRTDWKKEAGQGSASAKMEDVGYIVLQHASNPDHGLSKRILDLYHRIVLGTPPEASIPSPDPYHLATLKRYPSLMSLAQDAHKPMFLLKPADGAVGSHIEAVKDCYRDFKQLALRIASACGIAIPS